MLKAIQTLGSVKVSSAYAALSCVAGGLKRVPHGKKSSFTVNTRYRLLEYIKIQSNENIIHNFFVFLKMYTNIYKLFVDITNKIWAVQKVRYPVDTDLFIRKAYIKANQPTKLTNQPTSLPTNQLTNQLTNQPN